MNIADKQDFTLSVILVILVAIVVFSGVYMWMPHHGSGWIESEYSQGMMYNRTGSR